MHVNTLNIMWTKCENEKTYEKKEREKKKYEQTGPYSPSFKGGPFPA